MYFALVEALYLNVLYLDNFLQEKSFSSQVEIEQAVVRFLNTEVQIFLKCS